MEVDELFPYRELDNSEINEIKKYLDDNLSIKTRVISTNNNYTSIMIRPKNKANMTAVVNSIIPLSESALKDFDFSIYKGEIVALCCSSDAVIPMWAYMLITSYLNNISSEIWFGTKEDVILW